MKRSLLIVALLLAGCAARVQHPGTSNALDSSVYDTLLVGHSVIESTKTDIASGSVFPPNVLPAVKAALNGLIDAYNALDTVYCNPGAPIPSTGAATLQCSASSYHALAMAGTAPPALQSQVQTAQSNVNSATVALSSAKGGK